MSESDIVSHNAVGRKRYGINDVLEFLFSGGKKFQFFSASGSDNNSLWRRARLLQPAKAAVPCLKIIRDCCFTQTLARL